MKRRNLARAVYLIALAFVAGWLSAGCRTFSDQDVVLIRTGKAANAGHMKDESLPKEARLVAQDAYDAFCALDYSATGAALPEDVRARSEGRR